MKISGKIAAALVLTAACTGGANARADLLAYDGFNYQPGAQLQGQNGGMGFSTPWSAGAFNASITNNYVINGGSIADPTGTLATSGQSVSAGATNAISGLTRGLTTMLGAPGTTDYISVVLRPDGPTTGGTFNNFYGLYLNSSLGNDVFMGKPGNGPISDYDLENRGGTDQYDSGTAAVTGRSALLVMRVDFFSGIDRVTVYVNPTPGAREPFLGVVKQDVDLGTITGLTLYSTGGYSADEVRVGTTFADVVPAAMVPEPASVVLVGLGLAAGAGATYRGRRRARG